MSCSEVRTLLSAHLDGELDVSREVEIEEHLRTCDDCARARQAQLALRAALESEDLYFRAPAHLAQRIRGVVQPAPPKVSRSRPRMPGWLGAAAAAAAVALAFWVSPMLWRPSRTDRIAQDVVSAHIRSLMPGHLTDVPSSENHTVKPWFAGKLDFSPPIPDLSAEGFPLVGGRLDYVGERPVAALVYRKGEHLINVFVWPSGAAPESAVTAGVRQGYNLLSWTRGNTTCWVISDVNPAELRQFAELVRARVS